MGGSMMRLKSVLIAGISLCLFGLAQAQQPTNEAGGALVQQLSSYYPNLFCEDLFTKSQCKGDGFQFLRTEIPWYWDLLRRNPDQL